MSQPEDSVPDTAKLSTAPRAADSPPPDDRPVRVLCGATTHVGKVRQRNEDHFAIIRRRRSRDVIASNVELKNDGPDDEAYTLIVADGVGGEGFGDRASELAVRAGWESANQAACWLMKLDHSSATEIRQQVDAVAEAIQQAFLAQSRANPELAGMATTWTCAYITGWHAFVAHVGDSRAYHFHSGTISQLTSDHTLAEELRKSGADPQYLSKFRSVLTKAFGGDASEVAPDVLQLELEDGDALLLCSDGLSNTVTDAEMAELVQPSFDPQQTCDRLIEKALERGAPDNVTALLARVVVRD